MDDRLAVSLIVAGGAVCAAWIAGFGLVRWRARRRLVHGLESEDPLERARVGIRLVDRGRRSDAGALLAWAPTEGDVRTRLAIALAVQRHPWGHDGRAGRGGRQVAALRTWARLELERPRASGALPPSPDRAAPGEAAAPAAPASGPAPVVLIDEPAGAEATPEVEVELEAEVIRWQPGEPESDR